MVFVSRVPMRLLDWVLCTVLVLSFMSAALWFRYNDDVSNSGKTVDASYNDRSLSPASTL